MRRPLLIIAAACALAAAQPAHADYYPPNTPSLAPQSTEPVILGEVTDITSQAVMVRTPEGQVVPVHFDSHTTMSKQLESGTPVRVNYKLQENNVYLADRITPIERGSSDWNQMVAMEANAPDESDQYANNDMDRDHDMDRDYDNQTSGNMDNDNDRDDRYASNDRYSGHANDESDMSGRPYDQDQDHNGVNDHDQDDRQLPRTASSLTLVLMTGWLLLTAAGCMWLVRRRGV